MIAIFKMKCSLNKKFSNLKRMIGEILDKYELIQELNESGKANITQPSAVYSCIMVLKWTRFTLQDDHENLLVCQNQK